MNMTPAKRGESQLGSTRAERAFLPDVDLYSSDSGLVAVLDMPGVSKDGLEVRFEDGVLTVRGSVQREDPDGARLRWREHEVGSYHRAFEVREEIDVDKVAASYSDGVLTVQLPSVEQKKPRKIPIQDG